MGIINTTVFSMRKQRPQELSAIPRVYATWQLDKDLNSGRTDLQIHTFSARSPQFAKCSLLSQISSSLHTLVSLPQTLLSAFQILHNLHQQLRPGLRPLTALPPQRGRSLPPEHTTIWLVALISFSGCAMWCSGFQFPNQGLNPGPLQWKHSVLTPGPPGNSLLFIS